MKKHIVMLLAAMVLVLGACSSNDGDNSSKNNAGNDTNTGENQDQVTNDQNSTNNEDNAENDVDNNPGDETNNNGENQTNNDSEDSVSALADFPEYETLVKEIDVDTLDAQIETDNPNKRVIIYADSDGRKQYKSIFIKKQDHLKIIHFDNDGEIFNEVIK